MEALRDTVRRAASIAAPVVVCGPTGSGKELVARALHALSAHRSGQFCPVNVAALPEAILESEVFGTVRGAYTGAVTDRAGLAEAADGGTLFLDEAGDLPRCVQAKLLRVLESGEVRRLGATRDSRSQFRLVVAVQDEPAVLERTGSWRRDFYYRVTGVVVRVPALRDHASDIGVLAAAFLHTRGLPELDAASVSELEAHTWPGNVRELEHVLVRAVFYADGARFRSAHVRRALHEEDAYGARAAEPRSLDAARHLHVQQTVLACEGDTRRAAEILGISRTHVYRLLRSGNGAAVDAR